MSVRNGLWRSVMVDLKVCEGGWLSRNRQGRSLSRNCQSRFLSRNCRSWSLKILSFCIPIWNLAYFLVTLAVIDADSRQPQQTVANLFTRWRFATQYPQTFLISERLFVIAIIYLQKRSGRGILAVRCSFREMFKKVWFSKHQRGKLASVHVPLTLPFVGL